MDYDGFLLTTSTIVRVSSAALKRVVYTDCVYGGTMTIAHKLYLEPTVLYQLVNFSRSEYKEHATQLLEHAAREEYTLYISNFVMEEIWRNKPPYREKLEIALCKLKPTVIITDIETEDLAQAYMENTFKGRSRREIVTDACHAAAATVSNISYLVSYNYRNLLNMRILDHINAVNLLAGYNHHVLAIPPFMILEWSDYHGEKGEIDPAIWKIKDQCGQALLSLFDKKPSLRKKHYEEITRRTVDEYGLEVVQCSVKRGHPQDAKTFYTL